jgi:hypothetical protein
MVLAVCGYSVRGMAAEKGLFKCCIYSTRLPRQLVSGYPIPFEIFHCACEMCRPQIVTCEAYHPVLECTCLVTLTVILTSILIDAWQLETLLALKLIITAR